MRRQEDKEKETKRETTIIPVFMKLIKNSYYIYTCHNIHRLNLRQRELNGMIYFCRAEIDFPLLNPNLSFRRKNIIDAFGNRI